MSLCRSILMVGPDLEGLGGISRVTWLWRRAGIFDDHGVTHVATVMDRPGNKLATLASGLSRFLAHLPASRLVWVHTSSYRSFYRKAPFLAAAHLAGRPVVLHVHPTHFLDFLGSLRPGPRLLVEGLIRRCRAIAVVSEQTRRGLMERFPGLTVEVLPNPVDVDGLRNVSGVARRNDELLYLGWYIREKGIFELADAVGMVAADCPGAHLRLHGTKDRTAFDAHVRARNLGECVIPGGWLDVPAKVDALHRATALVLPSHSEGMPNVVLEAMATRTPVIATAVGGLADLLRDGENAFVVPPHDPIALATTIRRCLAAPEERAALADEAYRQVTAAHDLAAVRARVAAFITDLACEGSST